MPAASNMVVNGEIVIIEADRESASSSKKKKKEKKHAYFTATMMFLNTLLFVVTIYVYHEDTGKLFESFESNPNLGPNGAVLVKLGARDTPLIVGPEKEYWRLLTSMFLHAGLIHLLFNMFTLWGIGAPLERTFGSWGIAVIYFVAGLAGNFASAIFLPAQITVGASGAIYGLMGAFWGDFLQNWESYQGRRIQTIITLFVVTGGAIVIGMMPYADNFAHVGGFLGGVLSGLVLLAEKQSKGVAQAIRDAAEAYRKAQYAYHGRETFDELVDACHLFKSALHRECQGSKTKLRELFDKFKTTKKGGKDMLSPKGLNSMLSHLGVMLDQKTKQHLGFEMDKNKDREIEWDEFVGFIALDEATPDVVLDNIEAGEIERHENPACCNRDCLISMRQYLVGLLAALALIAYMIILFISLFYVNSDSEAHVANWCSWCDKVNCIETQWWDCAAGDAV